VGGALGISSLLHAHYRDLRKLRALPAETRVRLVQRSLATLEDTHDLAEERNLFETTSVSIFLLPLKFGHLDLRSCNRIVPGNEQLGQCIDLHKQTLAVRTV
jgi:hypothetical protein